ncbi:putative glycosyl hydrolase 47 family protein [Lyophyllum shimeji]|uniref:alpha-1,2-Mannosidase n=1 Tax=Lyophyllum shimeji TaxID=47721 RepID=A0A9P3PJV1_LYOSH|nr:putative glycosyl hydrolase 47 family protein [Lyophyllum shimeji]
MADNTLRQRKNEDGNREAGGKTHGSEKSNGHPTPRKSSSSNMSVKGFVGLVAFLLAALLYKSVYLSGPKDTTLVAQGIKYLPADLEKRDAIVNAFKHAWLAYERDAMGDDEYHPISKKGSNLTKAGGIGYTVVDSLDTMQIMGLEEEYARARTWVTNKLSFDRDAKFNTFETTIRVLGGLLSAYHLSGGDELYLERATDLADRMMPVFDTPTGLPTSEVNLGKRQGIEDPNNVVSTAEASTIQLELRYLSYLTDNEEYWDKAENVMKVIKAAKLPSGLATIFMGGESGQFLMSQIRLGSRGDSYYEYLLKQYLQTNQTETVYREMYEDTMTAIHRNLLKKSPNKNLTYTAELVPQRGKRGAMYVLVLSLLPPTVPPLTNKLFSDWHTQHKQDHLVCFLGGSLMLGATTASAHTRRVSVPPHENELSPAGRRDWKTGEELIETCVDTYSGTATGLSPEIVYFRSADEAWAGKSKSDWYIKGARPVGQEPPYDARYILRPETIESLFIAYRLTGDERYREQGWAIFQAIEKYCRVEIGGYASILNVDDVNSKKEDRMETFMMSETLKYLYLLFSDSDVLPLSKYVFNTEAHPLPIFTPHSRRAFSTS